MGWAAARKLRTAVDGLSRVLAIEVLTAARGIELRAPLRPGAATGAAIGALRETVPGPGPDRFLAPEIEATYQLVRSGALLMAARSDLAPQNLTLRPSSGAQSQVLGRKVTSVGASGTEWCGQ